MRKIFLLCFILLNLTAINVYAISAQSAILIDMESGRVLFEKNANEKLPMASTTKIMTGLLACESGKFNEIVKTSSFASSTEGSSLWLKPGEKQLLKNLTYGLMLKSGNDAAVSIAEFLGGSTDAFAVLMTNRAKEIGAVNTSFKNPHGLDAEGHYTTAYDLALITREAMRNKYFSAIVSTKNYTIPQEGEKWGRALKNHNKMLWNYEGCTGVKTGFTKKCGRCLVTSAVRKNTSLICVTLNAPDDWNDHTYLLNYGFENFTTKKITEKGKKVCDYTYDEKNNRTVKLIYESDFNITVDRDDLIKTEIEYSKITAPVKKGTRVGYVRVYCNDEKVADIGIVTANEIKNITLIQKIKTIIMSFISKLIGMVSALFGL